MNHKLLTALITALIIISLVLIFLMYKNIIGLSVAIGLFCMAAGAGLLTFLLERKKK